MRDDAETAKLQRFAAELQGIEDALPIDAAMKNPKLGAMAPIRVVNELFAAGDAAKGVQTAAFNLPNDERIVREKGSKRVMLKNVQEAKFAKVLLPIAEVALGKADRAAVAFDPFFTHILMHELLHGLGPHEIVVGGRKTTVRAELGDTYSALEEAKADVAGLFALQKLLDEGKLDRAMQRTLYPTFLASAFRSIRFGVGEAHGRGMALQLSWLLDAGAITPAAGRHVRDRRRPDAGGGGLAHPRDHDDPGEGRPRGGEGAPRADGRRPARRCGACSTGCARIPVDIAPRFVTAEALTGR